MHIWGFCFPTCKCKKTQGSNFSTVYILKKLALFHYLERWRMENVLTLSTQCAIISAWQREDAELQLCRSGRRSDVSRTPGSKEQNQMFEWGGEHVSCDIFCFKNLIFLSANMNRKTFKTSVKPGWYYVGRKMVSTHTLHGFSKEPEMFLTAMCSH